MGRSPLKPRALFTVVVSLAVFAGGVLVGSPSAPVPIAGAEVQDPSLNILFAFLSEEGTSGALAVTRGDRVVTERYWSWRPGDVDARTLFNIGSLAKQMTGFIVLQLETEGKIPPGATVADFLDEARGSVIGALKVTDLLHMTSGLPHDERLWLKARTQIFGKRWTAPETVAEIQGERPGFAPGSRIRYSNLNYVLLGLIVGRIEGRPFADVLKRRIFVPFGMKDSFLDTFGDGSERLARGHLRFLGWWFPVPNWNYTFLQGAGGVVSNVGDLRRWLRGLAAFFGGHPSLAARYFGYDAEFSYGYGWSTARGWAAHTGESPGFCAYIVIDRAIDKSVVITLNSDFCVMGDFQDRMIELANAVMGGPL